MFCQVPNHFRQQKVPKPDKMKVRIELKRAKEKELKPVRMERSKEQKALDNLFLIAVEVADLNEMVKALRRGAFIFAKNEYGESAWDIARRCDNEWMLLQLDGTKSDNAHAEEGKHEGWRQKELNEEMLAAAESRNTRKVADLTKKGAYLDARNTDGENPVIIAVRNRDSQLFYLLNNVFGADVVFPEIYENPAVIAWLADLRKQRGRKTIEISKERKQYRADDWED